MQAEGIYEDYQPEVLGEVQHVLVYFQAEVARQNTDEENKGDSERNAEEFYPSEVQAQSTHERQHNHCLDYGRLEQYFLNIVHCLENR